MTQHTQPQGREFWQDKRVTVTGGSGFLGSFVVDKLRERGAADVFVPRSKDYDLRTREAILGSDTCRGLSPPHTAATFRHQRARRLRYRPRLFPKPTV